MDRSLSWWDIPMIVRQRPVGKLLFKTEPNGFVWHNEQHYLSTRINQVARAQILAVSSEPESEAQAGGPFDVRDPPPMIRSLRRV